MKRTFALLLAVLLLISCVPALADGLSYGSGSTRLISLNHNCPNTGIMVPEWFNPNVNSYLLTVADWVSRVILTPVAEDPMATITVNGQAVVRSGQSAPAIAMTDKPQAVSIVVYNGDAQNEYTVFLQRRPSEKRTRVSAGYINSVTQKNGKWYIDADLVTLSYLSSDYSTGSQSTFTNKVKEVGTYKYAVNPHCDLFYGSQTYPTYCYTMQQFANNYDRAGGTLYKFVYIEDEIVAVYPYDAF